MGEMLDAAKKAGQIQRGGSGNNQYGNVPNQNNSKITLEQAGIDRKLSSRVQKIAGIPKEEFEQQIAEQKATGKATNLSPNKIAGKSKKRTDPPLKPHRQADEIIPLYDEGKTTPEIAASVGMSPRKVRDVIKEERFRRQGEQEGKAIIDPESLSMSAQEKLKRAISQEKERFHREFEAYKYKWLNEKTESYLERLLPKLKAEQDQAKRIMERREGFMAKQSYRLILSCLHPDWVTDSKQKARYDNAFREFSKLEKFVLNEKDSPTVFTKLPTTLEELKRQRSENQKAARNAKKAVI